MSRFAVRAGDLADPAVRDLLAHHLAAMRAASPPGTSFALDLSGLAAPHIRLWTAWDGDALAAVGALALPPGGPAEVKSMRTHPDHLGRGAASAILAAIVTAAAAGARRLHLETGTGPAFVAAEALYVRRGFVPCAAFGDYRPSDFNRFYALDLARPAPLPLASGA